MNDDRWLEDLLQEPAPHLDDDGFTARVVARLPRHANAERRIILGLTTLLAALVAMLSPAHRGITAAVDLMADLILAVGHVGPGTPIALPGLIAGAVLVIVATWGAIGLARTQEGI
jgi:hypothetical protein